MDRPIQKKPNKRKIYLTAIFFLALIVIGYFILTDGSSKRAEKSRLQFKSVKSGPFNVYVIGNGTVVSRDSDYILSKAAGELVVANVKSGDPVVKDQVLFVIANPEITAELDNREIALAEAKAELHAKKFELETQRLELERTTLEAESVYKVQKAEYEAYKSFMDKPNPPVSLLLFRQSEIKETQSKKVYDLELNRAANFKASMKTQLKQYESRVNLAQSMLKRTSDRVNELTLKAKSNGIIQDVDLKPGQHVDVGTVVGVVSNPDEIYVRLKIPAIQGQKLVRGQAATITIGTQDKNGKVVRIDPNVKGTTIDVDIELEGDTKLKSNMFVSGKIIVQQVPNAMYVESPSGAVENGTSAFYRVTEDGSHLQLVKVDTGSLSSGNIEVRKGLRIGDSIVVSDVGQFSGADLISLH